MNQENTFLFAGVWRHITINPLMAMQLDDLTDPTSDHVGLSAIIGFAVNRLHANMAANMRPIPGQETPVEVMPDGDPLTALCELWRVRHQEVVKVALFDAWREWRGMP